MKINGIHVHRIDELDDGKQMIFGNIDDTCNFLKIKGKNELSEFLQNTHQSSDRSYFAIKLSKKNEKIIKISTFTDFVGSDAVIWSINPSDQLTYKAWKKDPSIWK